MPARLADLAVRFGCELRGDPDAVVDRVASLDDAGPGAISFLANPQYRRHLAGTRATAVVLDAAAAAECTVAALVVRNPYATYARIAATLHPLPVVEGGRHPSASVDPGADVDPSASIGACAYVAAGARVGPRVLVGPGSLVLEGASLGADTRLVARVTIGPGSVVGERCVLHPGSVIGGDGFGHAPDRDGYVRVPQVGRAVLGNDVDVGCNSTVDRGAIGDTVLEDGVRIDNLVQIGHNVRVGAHTVIAACCGISGSTVIGRRCMVGGQVGISGHLQIVDDVILTGRTMVTSPIRKAGVYSSGIPADEAKRFRRNVARFHRLDELARRVRQLEKATGTATGEEQDE
ncbi:MAG: UDP-3-O-(3-hydroxymyristoyl)glucosamine N-acyltransferase [Steroidobacteraceae bacterium]